MITELARHGLETSYGRFMLGGYLFGDNQQVVLVLWKLAPGQDTLLRVQYGCLNGTVFGAIDCDCKSQIDASLRQIARNGHGVFVYFADHEAYGLGLASKMQIVSLEKIHRKSFSEIVSDKALPRVAVDVLWTLPHIFDMLGLKRDVVILGNNIHKIKRLQELGFNISAVEEIEISVSDLHEDAVREINAKKIASAMHRAK